MTQPVTRRNLASPRLAGGKLVDRVQITEIELAPGQGNAPHDHPVPVVGYVVAGRITFQVHAEPPRTLGAGEAFYEPANVEIDHFDKASPSEPATFVAMYLLGSHDGDDVIRFLA